MKNVARALMTTAAFIELADEETIQLDAAAEALEQIAATLQAVTPEEYELLEIVAAELAQEAREGGPVSAHAVSFYETFIENFGVSLEDETGFNQPLPRGSAESP